MRACHPASAFAVTELLREVSTPHPLAFTEGKALIVRLEGVRNSRLRGKAWMPSYKMVGLALGP
ncbi:MAG: hypothetical protein DI605_11115 [Sphingomonas sp.]|nr:MAG: hypothetical protein DI605_11115 [Sphingomonas sp.]